jgi:hypothetical protein
MGKGSQQVPTESTVRQTQLPEYADPYFRRLLQGAEEVTMPFDPVTGQSTYIPYGGERIAPSEIYGDIQSSRAMVRGIAEQGIAGMPEAMGAAQRGMGYQEQAIQGLRGLADYQAGQFDPYAGFQAADTGALLGSSKPLIRQGMKVSGKLSTRHLVSSSSSSSVGLRSLVSLISVLTISSSSFSISNLSGLLVLLSSSTCRPTCSLLWSSSSVKLSWSSSVRAQVVQRRPFRLVPLADLVKLCRRLWQKRL